MITVLNHDIEDSLYLELVLLTRNKRTLEAVKLLHTSLREQPSLPPSDTNRSMVGLKECKQMVDFIATDPTVEKH